MLAFTLTMFRKRVALISSIHNPEFVTWIYYISNIAELEMSLYRNSSIQQNVVLCACDLSAQSRAVSMEMMNSRPFSMNLWPVWATYVTMFQRTKKERRKTKRK